MPENKPAPRVIDCSSFRCERLPSGGIRLHIDNPTKPPDALLTKREIASFIGKSLRSVGMYMRRKTNPIPHCFVGSRPRFQADAVLGWAHSGRGSTKRDVARALFT